MLHPHLHALIPDGLFVETDADGPLEFVALPPPTPESIEAVTLRIARRVSADVERRVEDDAEIGGRLEETAASMQEALQRALKLPSPADQLTWSDPDDDHATGRARLCAKVAGFSLHAGQAVAADDREGLERLCRYGLRAPFSQERLSLTESGEVVYTLPRPWPNASGVTELVMAPTEFLKRLAALIPSPGTHMTRYHGVFANRSRFRRRVPAPPVRERTALEARVAPPVSPSSEAAPADGERSHRQRLSWAQLLARVFLIDVLRCPDVRRPPTDRVVSDGPEGGAADPDASRLPTEAPVVKPARMLAEMGPMLEFDDDDAPDPDDDPWAELGTTEDERAPP